MPCTESQTDATISPDQFSCACLTGFANGVCAAGYIPEYESQCHVTEGGACDVDINECDSDPCLNGAACADSNAGPAVAIDEYVCSCAPGWEGENCNIDIDECASDPCRNNAPCTESTSDQTLDPGGYSCACLDGYSNGWCDYVEVVENYTAACAIRTTYSGGVSVADGEGNCDGLGPNG